MFTEKELTNLINQLNCIIDNKPVPEEIRLNNPASAELQKTIDLMISEVSAREREFNEQLKALQESNDYIMSVMDNLQEWVITTDSSNDEIIYLNESAKRQFFDPQSNMPCNIACECYDMLADMLKSDKVTEDPREYYCNKSNKYLYINSYPVNINNRASYIHHVEDITQEKTEWDEMSTMAYKDELTGLFNRRYFTEMLSKLEKEPANFTLCVIDADKLKRVNDNFGHLSGDEYICTVAELLKKTARNSDIVSRMGGDEFAIIFLNCNPGIVYEKMEKLNSILAESSTNYPMSVSFGAVHVNGAFNSGKVLNEADSLMYEQKKTKNK